MGISKREHISFILTLVSTLVFILFSCAFSASYIFIDYKKYRQAYTKRQTQELKRIGQKQETVLQNLKSLLYLAQARIQAAHGNPRRLQSILSSLHPLQDFQGLPGIKKVSYKTLIPPYLEISRFGISPLGSSDKNKFLAAIDGASIQFGKKGVQGKIVVSGLKGAVGILEIQISLTAFKAFLGPYETVSFDHSSEGERQVPYFPFPLYKKIPSSFWEYALVHKSYYAIFAAYALLSTLLLGFGIRFLKGHFRKRYQEKAVALVEAYSTISHEEKVLRKELGKHQLEAQVHQMACQTHKAIRHR